MKLSVPVVPVVLADQLKVEVVPHVSDDDNAEDEELVEESERMLECVGEFPAPCVFPLILLSVVCPLFGGPTHGGLVCGI